MVKKNHQNDPSVGITPSIWFTFSIRGQLQGSVRVRSMKVSTNQWHNYGSVHLAIFDHLWVFEIVSVVSCLVLNARTVKRHKEEVEEFQKREKRRQWLLYLVFTYVIFNMGDVAISPKYNFEKLLRKLPISDFYWLKTYRVWCIVSLMANPLKCLDEWTIYIYRYHKSMRPLQERCMTAKFIQANKVKSSDMNNISLHTS